MNKCEFNSTPIKPKIGRRKFMITSLVGGAYLLGLPLNAATIFSDWDKFKYNLSLNVPTRFFNGDNCWVQSRVEIIPEAGDDVLPRVVMTMSRKDLSGSDVFRATYGMESCDMGLIWTNPKEIHELEPRYEMIDGVKRPVAIGGFQPAWHNASRVLLGIGHTLVYTPEWKITSPRPRHTAFSVYNPDESKWSEWQKFELPDSNKFYNSGAGSVQRYDKADGTILLPIYFKPRREKKSSVTVIHCSFDEKNLRYLRHGTELSIDDNTRGLHEPSLTFFKGEYFMSIRNDKQGFVSRSSDGLKFSPIQSWKFDDGTDLGNYNTQQNWVTHSDGLFLVYNRRGANNDHVFRHRAPLFMAQVDPSNLRIIRETERILVPERGARLGNFGITDVSSNETWVTVAEWMQPRGVQKYGSDGSVFIARIHWDRPNNLFST